ncbi:peroxiredoxin [Blastochloris viridis]|uniref:thioredoxin-dependent peroxiredoxin n=1 Tax=Blastochloris viridis TaxID=1079 RepID=A0A0H5BBP2_BLAVI|nr:peroxiredoxin [Blastochloris viridis]ALK08913.1 Putative peroxiredoxin bcp [Blastochloris viridis]BAR97691.1 thiol peroxidase [Blastochloris viridis]CUU41574.1 Putative peroxiredoxin bcp [Blastochloris viridis]
MVPTDSSTAPAALVVGEPAPAFDLPAAGGGRVSLASFAGKPLVVYFFPKADTQGCTREALAFSALKPAFDRAGVAVIGVSADPISRQDKFKAKHDLAVALGSDETRAMVEAYGVWVEKSLYGKTSMGIERATVLIGPDGRVARVWRKVKVDGHADQVLAAATAL